jgi:predicted kinase
MQSIYIPIGLPGCGKTTFYETRLKDKNVIRISADDIRFKLLDSENTQIYFDESIEKDVWAEYYDELNYHLEHDASIYVDCTNLTLAKRMKIYEMITKSHCESFQIQYICFVLTAEQCWHNQQDRKRKVQLSILVQMEKSFEPISDIELQLFNQKACIQTLLDLNEMQLIEII